MDYLIIIKNQLKKERAVNTAIVNYYGLLDDESEREEEAEQEPEREEPEQEQDEIQYDGDDFIVKNKSAMKRTLNLYNIKLKPTTDGLNPMEDDQFNYSREKKREFLRKKLDEIGQFKCNTIMSSEMTNVKNKKKIYPFFQTRYIVIRNYDDIEEFLRESEKDVIN